MTEDDARKVEHDCARLLTSFYAALDGQRYDAVLASFTEDGVWFRMGEQLKGKAAIKPVLDARFQGAVVIHGISNIHFQEVGETRAQSQALVVVYAGKPAAAGEPAKGGLIAVTTAVTEYVRTAQGWRIAHHDGRPDITAA